MTPAASATADPADAFFRRGWVAFPHDPDIARWAAAARPLADRIAADPDLRDRWLRCGGTWFAGVNVLPNDALGAVAAEGVPPLAGAPLRFIADTLGLAGFDWDAAQVSVCYPGYPAAPSVDESEAAFRYRRDRDAAHVDGLERDAERRRRPGEAHGFILGIPLTPTPPGAAPFVVWEGSHEIVRTAFRERLGGIDPARWRDEDVTDAYVAARRRIFADCPRVPVHAAPGGAYLVHRLALHGVAPWAPDGGDAPRAIAYFRPETWPGGTLEKWLNAP